MCLKPCSKNYNYLYEDGSCRYDCPSPFVSTFIDNVAFCLTPCRTDEYFHQDGTCLETCPATFYNKNESGLTYCLLPNCKVGQYVSYNGTCISYCLSPMIIRVEPNFDYCVSPCQSSDDFCEKMDLVWEIVLLHLNQDIIGWTSLNVLLLVLQQMIIYIKTFRAHQFVLFLLQSK